MTVDIHTALQESLIPTNKRLAIGNDIVYLPSFDRSLTPLFIKRGYTVQEIAYCEQFADSRLRYASTWAAKEAVYKAVKQVDENIRLWWRQIEICRAKPQGKPTVIIKKDSAAFDIGLTISHDGDYVWAIAVVVDPMVACLIQSRDTNANESFYRDFGNEMAKEENLINIEF